MRPSRYASKMCKCAIFLFYVLQNEKKNPNFACSHRYQQINVNRTRTYIFHWPIQFSTNWILISPMHILSAGYRSSFVTDPPLTTWVDFSNQLKCYYLCSLCYPYCTIAPTRIVISWRCLEWVSKRNIPSYYTIQRNTAVQHNTIWPKPHWK